MLFFLNLKDNKQQAERRTTYQWRHHVCDSRVLGDQLESAEATFHLWFMAFKLSLWILITFIFVIYLLDISVMEEVDVEPVITVSYRRGQISPQSSN